MSRMFWGKAKNRSSSTAWHNRHVEEIDHGIERTAPTERLNETLHQTVQGFACTAPTFPPIFKVLFPPPLSHKHARMTRGRDQPLHRFSRGLHLPKTELIELLTDDIMRQCKGIGNSDFRSWWHHGFTHAMRKNRRGGSDSNCVTKPRVRSQSSGCASSGWASSRTGHTFQSG